jgi:predicted membrane protein
LCIFLPTYIYMTYTLLSNLVYLIAWIIWRFYVGIYTLPMFMLFVASSLYHRTHEQNQIYAYIDKVCAYWVIVLNCYMFLFSYTSIYTQIWSTIALLSIFLYTTAQQKDYEYIHSRRHITTAIGTLCIYIGYANTL